MINPEQVSSYQVARSFCNKSILSNPKLQSNFLNAELVNLGIRGGEKRRGKSLVSLAGRMGASRRCCRSLLKRWCIKYDIEARTEGSVPFPPMYFRTREGYSAVEGLRQVQPLNTWSEAVDFKASDPPRALWDRRISARADMMRCSTRFGGLFFPVITFIFESFFFFNSFYFSHTLLVWPRRQLAKWTTIR